MNYNKFTRLFIQESLKNEFIELTHLADVHYLINVMRKKPKDQILVFNSEDGEYLAAIEKISSKKIILNLIQKVRDIEAEIEINLIFSPIKQARNLFLLEKATELGVTNLFPIKTSHSVVNAVNQEKWQIYVKEAAEQCRRLSVPKINKLENFNNFLEKWPQDKEIIFCNEKEQETTLSNYLLEKKQASYSFLIGPEGGFSELEINNLITKKFVKSVSLGKRILRAETACVAVLAKIS